MFMKDCYLNLDDRKDGQKMKVIGHESKHNVDRKGMKMMYTQCAHCPAMIDFDESELGSYYNTVTSKSYVELVCPECGQPTVLWEYYEGKRVRRWPFFTSQI